MFRSGSGDGCDQVTILLCSGRAVEMAVISHYSVVFRSGSGDGCDQVTILLCSGRAVEMAVIKSLFCCVQVGQWRWL